MSGGEGRQEMEFSPSLSSPCFPPGEVQADRPRAAVPAGGAAGIHRRQEVPAAGQERPGVRL